MASKKQIAANRRNSAKSSGPRSDQGKQIARTNALKFGLRAESLILPGEDPEEFEALFQSLAEYYHPVGTAEWLQLEKAVRYQWRLQRLNRIETAILRREHFAIELERAKEGMDRAREAVEGHDEDFIKLVSLIPLDEEELALRCQRIPELSGNSWKNALRLKGRFEPQRIRRNDSSLHRGRVPRHGTIFIDERTVFRYACSP